MSLKLLEVLTCDFRGPSLWIQEVHLSSLAQIFNFLGARLWALHVDFFLEIKKIKFGQDCGRKWRKSLGGMKLWALLLFPFFYYLFIFLLQSISASHSWEWKGELFLIHGNKKEGSFLEKIQVEKDKKKRYFAFSLNMKPLLFILLVSIFFYLWKLT